MAFSLGTIKDWTPQYLMKWLQDVLTSQPPSFLPLLKAEEVHVTKKLVIEDQLQITRDPVYRRIGTTGQPGFTNGWVNFAGGWGDAAYWKDPLGGIHLRGLIKSGTIGSAAFTLAPGYRPAANETFAVGSGAAGGLGRVDVQVDGQVIPQSPATNVWVSLSGIYFRTS